MIYTQAIAWQDNLLRKQEIIGTLHQGLDGRFARQKVLVLIPDHTRSQPLSFLFRALVDILRDTKQLNFMVALGTHPPLSEENLNKLADITTEERSNTFKHIDLLNHAWDKQAYPFWPREFGGQTRKQVAGNCKTPLRAGWKTFPTRQPRLLRWNGRCSASASASDT